jgi:hypothetical protein
VKETPQDDVEGTLRKSSRRTVELQILSLSSKKREPLDAYAILEKEREATKSA